MRLPGVLLGLGLLVVAPPAPGVVAAEPPPCAHPALAPLAALAGDWDVRLYSRMSGNPTDWDTSTAGSRIEPAIRDCAWIERFTGSRRGRPYEVLRVFGAAPGDSGLQVVAADSDHGPLSLSRGGPDSTGLAFHTRVTTPGGEVRLRLRIVEVTADGFVVENHRSPAGSTTWDRTGRAEYRRRAAAVPPR